ncbi:uncharacterized protein LOC126895244 isoform X2 [Daktulosphaira vitifoliae]|uniref:uncharacterized protein LOC126895244 isoform X2 n=1 Tax=Daktulosphaira vitifoliae TaxID=58002 RepID=UPI0021AA2471|nr:uncharacterized protein LOC126895244 isoform X2 [Daktulosphaira vitifoliae]
MRIKINRQYLTFSKNADLCWLYVDTSKISLIKHLKLKIQDVLKEERNIDVCFDNIPFLDEDEINAINDGEEITVIFKDNENSKQESLSHQLQDHFIPDDNTICKNSSSNRLSIENLEFVPVNRIDSTASISSITSNTTSQVKKRKRVRNHKKKKIQHDDNISMNNYNGVYDTVSQLTLNNEKKNHKRFKMEEEENGKTFNGSESISSIEETFHITREVYSCNSSYLDIEENTVVSKPKTEWKQYQFKTIPSNNKSVPIFIRGQTHKASNNYSQNNSVVENNFENKTPNYNDDCDMLVVDWKNMSPVKIKDLTELKIYDLLQFKTLSLNEHCEPEMSSLITSRLVNIDGDTLKIQVLSGIKEFMTLNPKFRMEDDDIEVETLREYKKNQ